MQMGCWPKAAEEKPSIAELFKKPLITGASVSAGYGTASPGRRLSLRHTTEKNINTVAAGGTSGIDLEARLGEDVLEDRTVILAMDFFFWDSTLASSDKSEAAIDNLIAKAEKLGIPIVLGDIPELLPGRQPSRKTLNAKIEKACARYERCVVLKLDELARRVRREGGLEIKGRYYPFHELVPDGLHLSAVAADYLADFIQQQL